MTLVEHEPSDMMARLARHAETRPNDLALRFPPGKIYTWAALWIQVRRVARTLLDGGLHAGDRVNILSDVPHDQVLGFLGAVAAGAVPAILSHPSIKQSDERFLVTLAGVLEHDEGRAWLLCSSEFQERASRWSETKGLRIRTLTVPYAALPEPLAELGPPLETFFIQYSSGTTGMRKGVAVTYRMFRAQARAYLERVGLSQTDVVVSWLPLYHDMGLIACLLLSLWVGAPSIHISPFAWLRDPSSLLDLVAEHEATFTFLPNFALRLLCERVPTSHATRVGSLRVIVNAGEPVRPSAHDAFLRRFAAHGARPEMLQCLYGLAESVFGVTQTRPGMAPRRDRVERLTFQMFQRAVPSSNDDEQVLEFMSSGPALPNHHVRVVRDGEVVADREVGELEVKSDSLFDGYVSARATFTAEGWFPTGDLGYTLGEDVFVTGRIKDLIIHRGSNLHPEDLEEAITWVPGCKHGRVVVFAIYDEDAGTDRVIAMLEAESDEADLDSLAAEARARVHDGFGVVLADLVVVSAGTLLKSTSGKLSRSANREIYRERFASRTR